MEVSLKFKVGDVCRVKSETYKHQNGLIVEVTEYYTTRSENFTYVTKCLTGSGSRLYNDEDLVKLSKLELALK